MIENNPLFARLTELEETVGEKNVQRLELKRLRRIAGRTLQFEAECADCSQHRAELEQLLPVVSGNPGSKSEAFKVYSKQLNAMAEHLQKTHKLIPEGYHLAVYMSLGMSIGLVFGLTLFDNIALGLPIGMSIGLAIGAGLDADAKKKGKTI